MEYFLVFLMANKYANIRIKQASNKNFMFLVKILFEI